MREPNRKNPGRQEETWREQYPWSQGKKAFKERVTLTNATDNEYGEH